MHFVNADLSGKSAMIKLHKMAKCRITAQNSEFIDGKRVNFKFQFHVL